MYYDELDWINPSQTFIRGIEKKE